MIDEDKIGKLIQEERKKIDLSQEQLAEKLFVTRQAVSKWEVGRGVPDYTCMLKLCDLFDITPNELLKGERIKKQNKKEINELPIQILKNAKDRRKKMFILFVSILLFITLLFFVIYFFNTYKKVEIYSIRGENDNFKIFNSQMVVTNDETFLTLNTIDTFKEILEIQLYYLKDSSRKDLFTSSCPSPSAPSKFAITIAQRKGGSEYFVYKDIKTLMENLYIDIIYFDDEEKKTDTIKLEMMQQYINHRILFRYADEEELAPIQSDDTSFDDKLKRKIINENFVYEKEKDTGYNVYVKKYEDNVTIKIYPDNKILTINNDKNGEWFICNYQYKDYFEYRFAKYDDDKEVMSSVMFDGKISCDDENCFNDIVYYKYYIDKYINPLFNFE